MDAHTLDLLEFDKVRGLLAEYATTSLGADLARRVEPSRDVDNVRTNLGLVSEMVEALMANHAPPFGGVHDIRLLVRRAAIGTMLTADQLLQVADTLTLHAARDTWKTGFDFQRYHFDGFSNSRLGGDYRSNGDRGGTHH